MMDRKRIAKQAAAVIGIPIIAFGTMGFWRSSEKKGLDPKDVADMLHTVMSSDRLGDLEKAQNRRSLPIESCRQVDPVEQSSIRRVFVSSSLWTAIANSLTLPAGLANI